MNAESNRESERQPQAGQDRVILAEVAPQVYADDVRMLAAEGADDLP